MSDERIAKILEWLAERITKAENFVIEQAPDVVQQIITMDVAMAVYGIAIFGLLLLATLITMRAIWIVTSNFDDEEDRIMTRGLSFFVLFFACVGMLVGAGCNARTVIKATVAPKAYLLERVGVLK